jgi:hypothetical protein
LTNLTFLILYLILPNGIKSIYKAALNALGTQGQPSDKKMKEIMEKGGRWCNIVMDILDSRTYPYLHIFF